LKFSTVIVAALLTVVLVFAEDSIAEEDDGDPVRNGIRLSQLQTHPVRSIQFWRQGDTGRNPKTRIGPAPPELIEFLRLDNTFQGYSEKPVPASANSEFITDVEIAMASLPETIQTISRRMVFCIALIRDLGGGTGYMDVVAGVDGSAVGGFIVLDEGALDRTANAWASWKEQSAFRSSAEQRFDVQIEPPESDTRPNAIRYILLHELGHVIDAVLGVTQIAGGNTQNIRSRGFYGLSWIDPPPSQRTVLPGDTLRSRYDATWPEREQLAFYTFENSRFTLNDAASVYEWLRQTNFPTLYAATSSADDFAESFANYVHVVLDKRPYEVRLEQQQLSTNLLGSCWNSPRCASKKMAVEHLLARAAQRQ